LAVTTDVDAALPCISYHSIILTFDGSCGGKCDHVLKQR
jgi:thiamine pyrophosphokinase